MNFMLHRSVLIFCLSGKEAEKNVLVKYITYRNNSRNIEKLLQQ